MLKKILLILPGFQPLCRRLTRNHVRVIMYHRFCPEGENHPRRLAAAEFSWQLRYLAKYHLGWNPDDQLEHLKRPASPPDRPPFIITVDDGYADFASVAFPLLSESNLSAMVFITTGFISKDTWFWWDRLSWVLENHPPGEKKFQVAQHTIQGNTADENERWELWNEIADLLNSLSEKDREAALIELSASLDLNIPASAPNDYEAMNWDQVRELSSQGVIFGAHTVTHPVLSRVDASRGDDEITASRDHIANELGKAPLWFCYPQGKPDDFRSDTIEQVRRAGFVGSYTAFPNAVHRGDPMTLPRYGISDDHVEFQWILCGAKHLFSQWKSLFSPGGEGFD